MNRLTFPRNAFAGAMERLWRQPAHSLGFALGSNSDHQRCELLVGRETRIGRDSVELQCVTSFRPFPGRTLREPGVLLEIGRDAVVGQASGVWLDASGLLRRIDELSLPGAGMHVVRLGSRLAAPEAGDSIHSDPDSRTAGALGPAVVGRLAELAYGVIGVGRTGTRVARALAQFSPRRLVLIDPDVLEHHNLGEVEGLARREVGRKKARIVAERLRELHPDLELRAIEASVSSEEALAVLRGCEVLFCCADHDGARLAATMLASLFHRLLIDVATGVHRRPEFRMAADVRVVVPERGCLLCVGGLPDEARARTVLASSAAERAFESGRDWRAERAGSLASLNQVAVGLALRALEDVVSERLRDSLWAHLEFDPEGRCRIEYPARGIRAGCACQFSGLGVEGLRRVPAFVRGERARL